jgi:hypothetical protein
MYTYRALTVNVTDKYEDYKKRWRGATVDRQSDVYDSGRPERLFIPDEDGDDYLDFWQRAKGHFIDYLNELGKDGWKVVSWTPFSLHIGERYWPQGTFFMMRETPPDSHRPVLNS